MFTVPLPKPLDFSALQGLAGRVAARLDLDAARIPLSPSDHRLSFRMSPELRRPGYGGLAFRHSVVVTFTAVLAPTGLAVCVEHDQLDLVLELNALLKGAVEGELVPISAPTPLRAVA